MKSRNIWCQWAGVLGALVSFGATACGDVSSLEADGEEVGSSQQAISGVPSGSIRGFSNTCLDIPGASQVSGTDLIHWACTGSSNDRFGLRPRPDGGSDIVSVLGLDTGGDLLISGCLTVDVNTNRVEHAVCNNSVRQQFFMRGVQWKMPDGLCVSAVSSAVGSEIRATACGTQGSLEKWDFFDTREWIRLSGTNLCVSHASTNLGTKLKLQTCATTTVGGEFPGTVVVSSQSYYFQNLGELAVANATNRCVNVLGGLGADNRLGIWDGCGLGYANMQFYTRGTIQALGQCVDQLGANTTQGSPIGMYPCVPSAPNHNWEYHW